jgi:TPP-dependent pyruvate/acetoin dehydrogenase alpha subunit
MLIPDHLAATPTLPARAHGLSAADLLRMFELMLTARTVDRRLQALYRQGRVHGGVYSQEGNEGISVGTAWALADGDCLFPMHRSLGARLVRGDRLPVILAQLLGRAAGPTAGRDSGLHHDVLDRRIFAMISHLGTQLPVACGAAISMRLAGETDRVAVSYTGDGATALGDFHEGLNMAAVLRLPVILVVENNLYAYSTPNDGEFACATLAERGPGYGIAAETVDGTDVLATYLAMTRAVARARRGEGPTLLEARALRLRGHSEADAHEYVPKEQLEEGRRTEPLARFERFLREEGALDDARLESLKQRVQAEVEDALAAASALPAPEGADVAWGVHSEEGHPSRGRGVAGVPGLAGRAFREGAR